MRECDVLVSTGEQVSVALLAMALRDLGHAGARSFLGHQIRIDTDSAFGRARIAGIDAEHVLPPSTTATSSWWRASRAWTRTANITTLGRGGSDTTAVAMAAARESRRVRDLHRRRRRIHHRPADLPAARKLDRISYDEMLELASLGAKVLQIRSVEFAKRYQVPLHVRSSFSDSAGNLGRAGGTRRWKTFWCPE